MLKRLLFILLTVLILSGCSKNQHEIVFSSWGSITETAVLKTIIKNFEEENPNIKVKFLHIPQNYFQKIHLLFASNTAPDVIFINNLYLPVYANKLLDLSDIINKEDYYTQAIGGMTIEGKLLAVPRDISNFVFYVNTKKAGNCSLNFSFNDFLKILEELKTKEYFAVSFERDILYMTPYILTLGEKSGIDFYKNLEGKYAPKPSDIGSFTQAQMFIDGRIAMYLSGRWMYPIIKKNACFDFQVIPFPGYTEADSSGWAISKSSKNKADAIMFVQYLASKQSSEYFAKTGIIVPARKDASYLLNNPEEVAFLTAIKKSKTVKIDKNFNKTRDKLNKELFN